MPLMDFLTAWSKSFDPAAAAGANCTIQFRTSQPAYVSIKDGTCTLSAGTAPAADVTLILSDENLMALLEGELNGMMAFMTGKLQFEGDLMLARRLRTYFPQK